MEKKYSGEQGSITLSVVLGMSFISLIWGGMYGIHRYYVAKNQNELQSFTKKWSRLEQKFKSNKRYLKSQNH